ATGNRQQATGNRQQATGNRQQATGNRQQATGNRQQATAPEGNIGINSLIAVPHYPQKCCNRNISRNMIGYTSL
ncbi:MAG: hypothetical protein SWX82_08795, partial [Cyanobacteriota bacterium]|nr:hypothetical protein [Cyanobacteriota bacterium]